MDELTVDVTKVLPVIKKCCGIYEDDATWDLDILIALNSGMATLNQLGVTFVEIDANTLWTAITTDAPLKALIKTYLWMKTKQIFDPTQSNNAMEAMTNLLNEIEFRVMVSK